MQATTTTQADMRRPRFRRWRLLPVAVLGGVVVTIGLAFAQFVEDVNALSAPSNPRGDALVVMTGGQARIEVALQLLQGGAAERLLISGVHTETDAATLASRTHVDQALFDCCVDLDYAALDTAGNARETALWAQNHDFDTLLVVTSAYHIPRTTYELEALLPDTRLIAYPIDPGTNTDVARDGYSDTWSFGLLVREFLKLQLARGRHLTNSFS